MANTYRGEVTVSLAGRSYTLRPSFHILCQLEERIGLTLPELLRRVERKGLLASEILMILAIATRHDGSRPFDSAEIMDMPAEKVKLHALMPSLAHFLTQGAAGVDYAAMMETAYKVLRLEPAAFWNLTMPEFRVLLRTAHPSPTFPQVEELREMMRRYPDAA